VAGRYRQPQHPVLSRLAAIPAIINGLLNGAIAYAGHKDRAAVPLTVGAISSTEATVGSEAAVTVVVDIHTKRALLREP
jgi:hypothetical protein